MKFNYEGYSLKSGIYKILNTHTNRVYIGQAKELKARWKGHKSSLLNNKSQNKFMQNDFNKCKEMLGHDDFLEFHVLEVMLDSTQKGRNGQEEFWIKRYKEQGLKLYNFVEKIVQPEGYWLGKKRSKEDRLKMSVAKKGKHLSPATEFKPGPRPDLRGENSPSWGKTPWNKGKPFMQGVNHPRTKLWTNIRLISPIGELYTEISCVTIFAQMHGLDENLLREVLKEKRKSHKGWHLWETTMGEKRALK